MNESEQDKSSSSSLPPERNADKGHDNERWSLNDRVRIRILAWLDLIRRYRAHFSHHWARRSEMPVPRLTPVESEFLPAALSLQTEAFSPLGRWFGRILVGLVLTIVLWATLSKVDIVVVASGKIIPQARTKIIASIETARVRQIYVQEGQSVRAGDVLIELDTRMNDRQRDKAIGNRDAALLQIARSRALLSAISSKQLAEMTGLDGISPERIAEASAQLKGQWREFKARMERLNAEISGYQQQLSLARRQASDYESLAKNYDVSEHAWLEKEQNRIALETKLADARNQLRILIAETEKTAAEALNDGLKQASEFHQDAARAETYSELMKIVAPVDGTVQQLTVHTIGGVVPATQALMKIVPANQQIEVEALLANKDVGFVREGQRVAVKLASFDYTKYGMVTGTVTHVSRDAIQQGDGAQEAEGAGNAARKNGMMYSVRVLLDQHALNVDGEMRRLTPGMEVSIEIKTGTRRVIQYFLSPLIQYGHESINER